MHRLLPPSPGHSCTSPRITFMYQSVAIWLGCVVIRWMLICFFSLIPTSQWTHCLYYTVCFFATSSYLTQNTQPDNITVVAKRLKKERTSQKTQCYNIPSIGFIYQSVATWLCCVVILGCSTVSSALARTSQWTHSVSIIKDRFFPRSSYVTENTTR